MKCIDDEIPFEIPEGWEWCRLKDMCSICTGATFKKDDATQSQRGTRILRGGNILPFQVKLKDDDIFIPSNLVKENILLKQNDIVTPAVTSLENIGKMARIEADMLNTTVGGFVFILRPYYNNDTLSQYMLFVMSAPPTVEYMRSITNKSGQAFYNIGKERLATTLIPLPPYAEQRRIALTMSKTLPQVEKYAKHQTDLDRLNTNITVSLKKSILQEAIQGKLVPQDPNDEPASVLLERIREEKLRLLKEGKLKKKDITDSVIFKGEDNKYYEQIGKEVVDISEDMPFEIPESWSWSRLSMLVNMRIGKTPARGDSTFWDNGVHAWISISDLSQGDIIMTSKEKISDFAASSVMGVKSQAGSLLMSFKLTVGKTAILGIDAYHNEAIVTISTMCDENYYTRNYLAAILPLLTNYGDTKDAIKGKTLNSQSLNALLIPIPPHEEQRRIIENIQYLFSKLR